MKKISFYNHPIYVAVGNQKGGGPEEYGFEHL